MPAFIKPFRLGVLARTLLEPPHKTLVVSAFGLFSFDEPGELDVEMKMWPFLADALGPETALDAGLPKVRGEVLLGGPALAPRGRPVTALEVALRMGSVDKRLTVVGQRYFRMNAVGGYSMTEPERFSECPLDYGMAFGGPDFARNPIGRGYGARKLLERGELAPLPRLEDPRAPVASIDDVREPVAFGRVGIEWPQRAQYAGSYDAQWAATRWPATPANMRHELFNEAPADQWIAGYFKGDERFSLAGMNADEPLVRGALPGVRARCFVKFAGRDRQPLREVPMRIDTVWLFAAAKKGVLVFRGTTAVQDSDAADVSHIMVGWERLGDAPRSEVDYEDVFRRRTDPETAGASIAADSELGARVPEEEAARRQAERLALGREQRDGFQRKVDAQLDKMKREHGLDDKLAALTSGLPPGTPPPAIAMPAADPSLPVVPMPTPGDVARLDFDLRGALSAVDELQRVAQKRADEARDQANAARADAEEKIRALGVDPAARKEAEQRARVERLAAERHLDALEARVDADAFLRAIGQDSVPPEARAQATRAWEDGQKRAAEELRAARLLAEQPIDEEGLLPAVATYFGALVTQGLAAGRSYRGRDLAGIDLRGAKLAGLDFSDCFLERANLEGADLSDALFERAVLTAANLRGARCARAKLGDANLSGVSAALADFSAADLSRARLASADLSGATLAQAKLDDAQAMKANLSDAHLEGAHLAKAMLLGAKLERACADGADLGDAVLLEAILTGASFRAARLGAAVLLLVRADDTCFDDAVLDKLMAGHGASFARATFRGATGVRASFRGAVLERANFERALLDEADFGEAKLARATFSRASLKRTILSGADASDASFRRADLAEAMLRKARLERASFEGASLYGAFADEAVLDGADFARSNLQRARVRS